MSIITIGIDLAKNIFAVHGVNENGHAELVKPKAARDQLLPLVATAASKQRSQLTPIIPGSKFRCSFCGRGANDQRRLVAGAGAQICSECLALAHEILTEKK